MKADRPGDVIFVGRFRQQNSPQKEFMNPPQYHNGSLATSSFLVTGGAGFIGSHIVGYLIRNGCRKVRVLDNLSTGKLLNLEEYRDHPQLEWMEGDIRDFETCQRAVEGMDFVSHQAALGSVPRSIADPVTSNAVNVSGFLNILEASRRSGVRRMVYAASSSTYGDHPDLPKQEDKIGNPLSPYAVTKYVNELYGGVYSRIHGYHTIGLRYFNVFGPRQDPAGPYAAVIPIFIMAALERRSPFINGDGSHSRDFTYVENAVQANIRALLLPELSAHEILNIAFGASCSLNRLWEQITHLSGVSLEARHREARAGDVRHSLADIQKAKSLIGYHPLVSLEEGLKKTVEWYQGQYDRR